MSVLELARKAYARLRTERNGYPEEQRRQFRGYDINDRNDQSPPVVVVTDPADLAMVAAAAGESGLVGLDCETTGLDPRRDRVRLLSVACDTIAGGTAVYVVD